jgi:two-component system, sensor histidine kinase and response regulator
MSMSAKPEVFEIKLCPNSPDASIPAMPKLSVGYVSTNREEFMSYKQMLSASKYNSTFEMVYYTEVREIELSENRLPDVLLLDLSESEPLSFKDFRKLHKKFPLLPIITLIDFSTEDTGLKSIRAGAEDYLMKEVLNAYQLNKTIQSSIERNRLERSLWEMNKAMAEFSHIAAHDLKSPISTIASYIELLQNSAFDNVDDRNQVFKSIENATKRMSKLIDDLLTYSKTENSLLSVTLVDLEALLKHIAEDINCKRVLKVDALPMIEGNESQFYQLFKNLIENALKFVPAGSQPEIEVYAKPMVGSPNFVDIYVKDAGIGIKEEDFKKIFDAFTRVSSAYEGSGIGLATCKKVVTNHKGKITVRSKFGEGTTFILSLPTKQFGLKNS